MVAASYGDPSSCLGARHVGSPTRLYIKLNHDLGVRVIDEGPKRIDGQTRPADQRSVNFFLAIKAAMLSGLTLPP